MQQIYNFAAGPAALPAAVLQQAKMELLDFQGSGVSVMEISHRSKQFIAIAEQAEQDLRTLLDIPEEYHVLFLQGGARAQFAMIPMNLLGDGGKQQVAYVDTGLWSQQAIVQAECYAKVHVAASAKENNYTNIPEQSTWQIPTDSAYLHFTPNETIHGIEFHWLPESGDIPLIADMSSSILSRPTDVSRYGLIYAGAQKNIGPAGLTVVIVRSDLLDQAMKYTPDVFNYKVQAQAGSMRNTPPTFAWYLAGLVFKWLLDQGGVVAMAEVNQRKATKLYQAIDNNPMYTNSVAKSARSWMNIPFRLNPVELEANFLQAANANGLLALKGHRIVGGLRASIYNAVPEQAVDALVAFMDDFAQRHG